MIICFRRIRHIRVLVWLIFIVAGPGFGETPSIAIIPKPMRMTVLEGSFTLLPETPVIAEDNSSSLDSVAMALAEALGNGVGTVLRVYHKDYQPGEPAIRLSLDHSRQGTGSGEYRLKVRPDGILLASETSAGVFYGLQTLLQLVPATTGRVDSIGRRQSEIPSLEIQDAPRFRWRGMHLDVSRHFFPVSFIRKYIDLMAAYKFNVFHWHLTDDQGWRIEIRKYPRLTTVGAWRKETAGDSTPYGGYYTQAEVREVVDYARKRFITIVPEIEMPGHSLAALAAYPEFSCTGGPFEVGTEWGAVDDVFCPGNEETFSFLEDVLREVMDLFPGTYIHCGGDECPKVRWRECPKCRMRLRNEGLKGENELQSYFIRRIGAFLNKNGRLLVGWDEILEGGLAPGATVMSWRGIDGGIEAAKAGHDVVMTPSSYCYLDHYQGLADEPRALGGYLPLDSVYRFDPVPSVLTEVERAHVLGGQGNVWTEYMPVSRHVEYMIMPRMLAMSEVLWSPLQGRTYAEFLGRARIHFDRLAEHDVRFRVPPPEGLMPRSVIFGDTMLSLRRPVPECEIRYTLDGSEPSDSSALYRSPVSIKETSTMCMRTVLPNGRVSNTLHCTLSRVDRKRNGLSYRYYEGKWRKIPKFDRMRSVRRGRTYDLNVNGVPHRPDYFGVRFTGRLKIERAGTYTFALSSDDGSKLYIDGKLVVNNDGRHALDEASGTKALRPGLHPIRVDYFDHSGRESLELVIEGGGMSRQTIPPRLYFP